MTESDRQAVTILNAAAEAVEAERDVSNLSTPWRLSWINHAIQHISRPERDIYPKSRKGTKGRPVMRCGHSGDVMSLGCDPAECNLPECRIRK